MSSISLEPQPAPCENVCTECGTKFQTMDDEPMRRCFDCAMESWNHPTEVCAIEGCEFPRWRYPDYKWRINEHCRAHTKPWVREDAEVHHV
jgi:hypothetical protein